MFNVYKEVFSQKHFFPQVLLLWDLCLMSYQFNNFYYFFPHCLQTNFPVEEKDTGRADIIAPTLAAKEPDYQEDTAEAEQQ